MRITWVRCVTQVFFLIWFLWFCVTASVNETAAAQWPLNFFLNLDPLAALGVLLSTGFWPINFYLALVPVAATLILGRIFCGWICPLGTLQHFVGWVGQLGAKESAKQARRSPSRLMRLKYYALLLFLASAAAGWIFGGKGILFLSILDPLTLLHRGINQGILPLIGERTPVFPVRAHFAQGGFLICATLCGVLLAGLWRPRFFCRYLCPLGALYGLTARTALWRVGRTTPTCAACRRCDAHCEGACAPSSRIRWQECVLCMNCLYACPDGTIAYRTQRSAAGEDRSVDLTRRGIVVSILAGLFAPPFRRAGRHPTPDLVRPPGSEPESDFLARCIRCGQCMRVCPVNLLHPAIAEGSWVSFWTPVAKPSLAAGGCLLDCVACGYACPTGAIRTLSVAEKNGLGRYSARGPVRIGLAFVDRNRCLPWGFRRSCLVCQEVCPVTPKAIVIDESFEVLNDSELRVRRGDPLTLVLAGDGLQLPTAVVGELYCRLNNSQDARPRRIVDFNSQTISIDPKDPWESTPSPGTRVEVGILLRRPIVAPERCVGCGACEHACPLPGKRAIRVFAVNESRSPEHAVVLQPGST